MNVNNLWQEYDRIEKGFQEVFMNIFIFPNCLHQVCVELSTYHMHQASTEHDQ